MNKFLHALMNFIKTVICIVLFFVLTFLIQNLLNSRSVKYSSNNPPKYFAFLIDIPDDQNTYKTFPVFWPLPPDWSVNKERLEEYSKLSPTDNNFLQYEFKIYAEPANFKFSQGALKKNLGAGVFAWPDDLRFSQLDAKFPGWKFTTNPSSGSINKYAGDFNVHYEIKKVSPEIVRVVINEFIETGFALGKTTKYIYEVNSINRITPVSSRMTEVNGFPIIALLISFISVWLANKFLFSPFILKLNDKFEKNEFPNLK